MYLEGVQGSPVTLSQLIKWSAEGAGVSNPKGIFQDFALVSLHGSYQKVSGGLVGFSLPQNLTCNYIIVLLDPGGDFSP